jgi:glycosyltransferase involved in cell wall biosynthesis
MIKLAFITCNRLKYTRKALASVLADKEEKFDLTIWDNASTDGTPEFLSKELNDSRIKNIVLSKKNVGQIEATNRIWQDSNADLLGKLDNDCIVTPGWTNSLAIAHKDIPKLGVIACWHFSEIDFKYEIAQHKIQQFGKHRIFRHPWTCGTGLLIKRSTYEELGPIQGRDTTGYWLKMAKRGYINGFYYPLILQEHMDDPNSKEFCPEYHYDLAENMTTANRQLNKPNKNVQKKIIADRQRVHKTILNNLLKDPWDVEHYTGYRIKLRRIKSRFDNIFKILFKT